MSTEKGASVYISAAELEALANAAGLLSALHEASSSGQPELPAALSACHSILRKAGNAHRRAANKARIREAVRVAETILAE